MWKETSAVEITGYYFSIYRERLRKNEIKFGQDTSLPSPRTEPGTSRIVARVTVGSSFLVAPCQALKKYSDTGTQIVFISCTGGTTPFNTELSLLTARYAYQTDDISSPVAVWKYES
jgi:hypothetical protein